jgi:hypothetical protein
MDKLLLALTAALLMNTAWALDTLKGEVLETRDVEVYTYLRLKTKDGEVWAAVNKAPVKKGAQVTIENAMEMHDFKSKGLNKTFDRIVFGTLAGASPAAVSPHGGGTKVEITKVAVPKAQGPDARTVAELYAKGPQLKDKPVLLRGTVVKVTLAVMGKNWVHLRDGTGSASDNTNDVIATTTEKAEPGSVVLVKGVVHTDVDLGSGYAYKVLIENATLQK